MTKVDIRRLDSVTTNDTTATQLINENFEALQEAIENTISRDGTTPNFMDADLDLNSYKIINAGTPTNNTDVITKEYFDQNIGDTAGYAATAEQAADRASTAAQSAQGYSTVAAGAADVAQRARDFIESDPGFVAVSTDLLLGEDGSIYKANANKANIDTVAESISNVNTVSTDIANINAVADDLTNIDNVVTNMADINNVADDLTKIVAVADDLTKIDNVADNLTNIENVADDLTNIDAVADNIVNVNAVANNETNINAVNTNKTNIDTVATNIADVNSVAGDITKVAAVADDLTNIDAVNANKTNIDTVAGNNSNITAVAGNTANINAVDANKTNIDAVAGNSTNINIVAGDITNINAVAADLTNIDAASDYAAEAKQWAIGYPTEPVDGSAKYWAGQAATGQVQSDWTEVDTNAKSYIKNKPSTMPSAWGNITGTLSNQTDLQNALDTQNDTISNCILDIPQNIKVTLENNVLTLKSGSILTRTGSTYGTFTLTRDNVWTIGSALADGKYFMFTGGNGHTPNPKALTAVTSGDSSSYPANPNNTDVYFDTTVKRMYTWRSGQSIWEEYVQVYPFCVIEMKSGVASFAKGSNGCDMVFNGAGFIGHHAFVLPNVKALIPDGFNEDGSLKSISFTTNSLQIIGRNSPANSLSIGITNNGDLSINSNYREVNELPATGNNGEIIYVAPQNLIYYYNNGWTVQNKVIFIDFNKTSAEYLSDFTIRQPVRLVTTEILDNVQSQVDTNTTAIATKADDSAVVKLTGNQSISGTKTFSSDVEGPAFRAESSDGAYGVFGRGNIELSPATTSTNGGFIDFHYAGSSADYTSRIISLQNGLYVQGNNTFQVQTTYAKAPTPTEDTTSSTQIDTVGARNTKLANYQTTANLVTSVSSASTDSQYPSAKLFYDTCGDIETLINAL